jgi:hypothetical protein
MKKIRCNFDYGKNKRPCPWGETWVLSYRATLRYDRKQMSVDFHTGVCAGAPTAADVVECLVSDARTLISADFDFWDWCDEYGITPSRVEKATFDLVETQAGRLKQLLGADWEDIMNAEEVADYCD